MDLIFSTATFHWIKEREHFAAMVAARLAQRGELVVHHVRLNILAKRKVAA